MKKNYGAPQMELICLDADIIRTSGPISLFDGGEGKVQENEVYDFTSVFG